MLRMKFKMTKLVLVNMKLDKDMKFPFYTILGFPPLTRFNIKIFLLVVKNNFHLRFRYFRYHV